MYTFCLFKTVLHYIYINLLISIKKKKNYETQKLAIIHVIFHF